MIVPSHQVEGLTEYRLDNGLKVVLYPNQLTPTCTMCVTYLVGSRHENVGETGMAHLLEHLMFKGSKHYPNPTAEFTKRGMQFNGSTWMDRTNYFATFNATEDNMKWFLGWMADSMVNSFIAQKDLDTEMTVVRNEYEMGENNPSQVLFKRMQSVLFDWHNYGKNTIGAKSDIENVTIERLRAFYERYYQPDNAVITIGGAFDEATMLTWIEETLGQLPRPTRLLPQEWTQEPVADGEREFVVRRKGEATMLYIGYRAPSALSPDWEGVSFATTLLGQGPNARLHKAIVEPGLASMVMGFSMPGKDPGFVIFAAMVSPEQDLERVKARMIEVIEGDLKAHPPTEAEIERIRQENLTELERDYLDPNELVTELSDYIGYGDWRLFFVDRECVKNVTREDVLRMAGQVFLRDNRVVGVFLPTEDLERAHWAPAKTAEELLSEYTFPKEGQKVEAFDTSPDHLQEATQLVQHGELTLALLPKPALGGMVHVSMRFLTGNAHTHSLEDLLSASMMRDLLTCGTPDMTRQDIDDLLTQLKFEGSVFEFKTNREFLLPTLKLLGHLIQNAAFTEDEFEQLRQEELLRYRQHRDDPMSVAANEMVKVFNTYPKDDPRYSYSIEETLEGLERMTRERMLEFNRIRQTQRGFITVVGDFEPEEVTPAFMEYIAQAKTSDVPYEPIVRDYVEKPASRIVVDTPQKDNAVLLARVPLKLNRYDERLASFVIANWILGGSPGLSNRLMVRIRQQEGLSYGVQSTLKVNTLGDDASFNVMVMAQPANLAQAEASLRDELKKAWESGVTADELEEAKFAYLEHKLIERTRDENLARLSNALLEAHKDWHAISEHEARVSALTLEEVNRAMREMVNPDLLTVVLAGDLEAAKKAGKPLE